MQYLGWSGTRSGPGLGKVAWGAVLNFGRCWASLPMADAADGLCSLCVAHLIITQREPTEAWSMLCSLSSNQHPCKYLRPFLQWPGVVSGSHSLGSCLIRVNHAGTDDTTRLLTL